MVRAFFFYSRSHCLLLTSSTVSTQVPFHRSRNDPLLCAAGNISDELDPGANRPCRTWWVPQLLWSRVNYRCTIGCTCDHVSASFLQSNALEFDDSLDVAVMVEARWALEFQWNLRSWRSSVRNLVSSTDLYCTVARYIFEFVDSNVEYTKRWWAENIVIARVHSQLVLSRET